VTGFFSVEDYFDIDGLVEVRFKSREKLISMRIEDFLALAEHGYDPDKARGVEAVMAAGEKFHDVPCLRVEHNGDVANVVGHEGRHRARGLLAAGYTHMPVVLLTSPGEAGQSIRWSEQHDPSRFDYTTIWPSTLEAEYGALPGPDGSNFQIPFPVAREDAGTAYVQDNSPSSCEDAPEWCQEASHEAAGPITTQNTTRAPRMR